MKHTKRIGKKGLVILVLIVSAVVVTAGFISFYHKRHIASTIAKQILFDGVGVEEAEDTWTIENAIANNEYSESHTINLSGHSQANYTVYFAIVNDTELEVWVSLTDGGSAITELLLEPAVQQTIWYCCTVKDKVTEGNYNATITIE
jgi:uncharacterized membrane protein